VVDPLQDIEIDGPGVENVQCIIGYDGSEKVGERGCVCVLVV
jgi:hypothetical protein